MQHQSVMRQWLSRQERSEARFLPQVPSLQQSHWFLRLSHKRIHGGKSPSLWRFPDNTLETRDSPRYKKSFEKIVRLFFWRAATP